MFRVQILGERREKKVDGCRVCRFRVQKALGVCVSSVDMSQDIRIECFRFSLVLET